MNISPTNNQRGFVYLLAHNPKICFFIGVMFGFVFSFFLWKLGVLLDLSRLVGLGIAAAFFINGLCNLSPAWFDVPNGGMRIFLGMAKILSSLMSGALVFVIY